MIGKDYKCSTRFTHSEITPDFQYKKKVLVIKAVLILERLRIVFNLSSGLNILHGEALLSKFGVFKKAEVDAELLPFSSRKDERGSSIP